MHLITKPYQRPEGKKYGEMHTRKPKMAVFGDKDLKSAFSFNRGLGRNTPSVFEENGLFCLEKKKTSLANGFEKCK